MKRKQWTMAVCALALIGGTALVLTWLAGHQKLGTPGVKTIPIPGRDIKCVVELPEKVLNYESQGVEPDPIAVSVLPPDTSFGQRIYTNSSDFPIAMNVVLMGTDRTSLHKPQFCLTGAGWHIDRTESDAIQMDRPSLYLLPVTKLTVTKRLESDGQPVIGRGIYVYWYVADNRLSGDASGFQRMWWMAKELFATGVLQRWTYVTCFVVCPPGQEEAAYAQLKQFMAAAVPEFQLTPATSATGAPK